jgi:hypothetical protein
MPVGSANDPYKSGKTNYNVFTPPLLSRFTEGFEVTLQRFFQHVGHNWIPSTESEAFSRDSYAQGVVAIVFLTLRKRPA